MLPIVYGFPVLTLFVPYCFSTPLLEDDWSGRENTLKQDVNETAVVETTTKKPRTRACTCSNGKCKCCSGAVMQALNFPINQKLCVDVIYTPEEFEFDYNVNFNNRILYKNKVSGKNPRPLCLPLSRYLPVTACLKFSNIYMLGRNIHACLDVEGTFLEAEIFEVSFECFRLGTSGIAFLKPEDGGGLPELAPGPSTTETLDYDDSA